MNPTVERIQALFAQNDPNNYYWTNFQKFLRGHSHKAMAQLLTWPHWKMHEQKVLVALLEGFSAPAWYADTPQSQNWQLLTTARIRQNTAYDGTLNPLSTVRFNVLRSCWDDCSAAQRFSVWNHWGCGIGDVDEVGASFMHTCMQAWAPLSSAEAEWKIQALVGTFEKLGETVRSSQKTAHWVDVYSQMLEHEIKSMQGRWDMSNASVHTWRQLQGYPDFQRHLGHPHPWTESLCVAWSGPLVPNLPAPMIFRKQDERMRALTLTREQHPNPTNPLDHLLARALWDHFSRKPPRVAPEVQGLYGLLEGTKEMVSALLALTTMAQQETLDLDTSVFDYQP